MEREGLRLLLHEGDVKLRTVFFSTNAGHDGAQVFTPRREIL